MMSDQSKTKKQLLLSVHNALEEAESLFMMRGGLDSAERILVAMQDLLVLYHLIPEGVEP